MKILLIGINFGDYEKKIVEELKHQSHDVFYMFDSDPYHNIYSRIFPASVLSSINKQYREKSLLKHKEDYDYIIVLVGRELDAFFLHRLKEDNPNAIFILYLWDDVKRVENFEEVKRFYDRIYSFDLKDCRDYGFLHLPLFFSEKLNGEKNKMIGIYSALFNHSDRREIVEEINRQAKENGISTRFIMSLGRYEYFVHYRKYRNNNLTGIEFIYKPISEQQNYRNMENAVALLDIQFAGQIGLTMRTIECVGLCNKIITTNTSVKYYDFYHEDNVLVIDRKSPYLDVGWMEKSYKPLDPEIYEKYSLSTWVKVIIGKASLPNYIGEYKIDQLTF